MIFFNDHVKGKSGSKGSGKGKDFAPWRTQGSDPDGGDNGLAMEQVLQQLQILQAMRTTWAALSLRQPLFNCSATAVESQKDQQLQASAQA